MRSQGIRRGFACKAFIALCMVFILSRVAAAESLNVTVHASISGPLSGVKVYAFTEAGSYTGINATTDESGTVQFVKEDFSDGLYRFRIDYLTTQYWSADVLLPDSDMVPVVVEEAQISVGVSDGSAALAGINTYVFNEVGNYLNRNARTDSAGQAVFVLPLNLGIKCRADYLGYQFWSDPAAVVPALQIDLQIPSQPVDVTVQGRYQGNGQPVEGINTYLFKPTSSYLGILQITDSIGTVTFNLPAQPYRARADYLGQQFWSVDFTAANATIDIPLADAQVTVTGNGAALEGVKVYVFSPVGAYLGLWQTTDTSGQAIFRLPAGDYRFRADYLGSQFWSGTETLNADMVNPVAVSTGGGNLTLTVLKGAEQPLAGVKCYAFSEGGSYLGLSVTTDSAGNADFGLADGTYKIRMDYMGCQYWTDGFTVPVALVASYTIAHQDAVITVNQVYQTVSNPLVNVQCYLFTPAGSYLGTSAVTDAAGQATLNLPVNTYQIRADYLGQRFWSEVFNSQDVQVNVPTGVAEIHVSGAGQDLENVAVYVFSPSGAYLGITARTDTAGSVALTLPPGDYQFRADYLGSQYWAEGNLAADTVQWVELNTGGGAFTLTVDDGTAALVGIKVYAFNHSGTYLGLKATTDAVGNAVFGLSEGAYRFRVDHRGYQFWSDDYVVPGTMAATFSIPHQDITITVQRDYPASEPLEGVRTYLFSPADAYLGLNATTDADGQAVFRLPDQAYKVRVDYFGARFWSEEFQFNDATVAIAHGIAQIHVTKTGSDLSGAPVYLFSSADAYLGCRETTDAGGLASFLLPAQSYKFRVDESGEQHWSGVEAIAPGQTNAILIIIGTQLPSAPIITGGTATSGTIRVRPVENIADQFLVELTGTRDAGTSVWINGVESISAGDDPWSVQLTLTPGDNAFEAWLADEEGNQGPSEWVDIRMQSGHRVIYEYDASGRIKTIQASDETR